MPVRISYNPDDQIDQLIRATEEKVQVAKATYVRSVFAEEFKIDDRTSHNWQLSSAAKGLETVGLDVLNRYAHEPDLTKRAWQDVMWSAYRIRRSIGRVQANEISLRQLADEVVDGLLAQRQPELRLLLESVSLVDVTTTCETWSGYVEGEIIRSFLLLVRKKGGYEDLREAVTIIRKLRNLQPHRENVYLTQIPNDLDDSLGEFIKEQRAVVLMALYNVARAVEITGDFLMGQGAESIRSRRLSPQGIKDELDRFIFTARDILTGSEPELRLLVGKLGAGCKALIDASVFSVVMPPKTRQLLIDLAQDPKKPVLELWFSQREALRQSLLDPTRLAIVVSMPTSAGKTLLAELTILQTYYNDPTGRIVYLAPTRALVTQVSLTLQRHLGKTLTVRVATPTFELDPIEEEVLTGDYEILVTTPEKLDLLVRMDHPSVQNISLVVVDEAHNINDASRGARLELLLATLRRERTETRFLLLTPFAKNARDLTRWLGGEQGGAPIVIDWKPNDRVIGVLSPGRKMNNKRALKFVSLDSAHSDCPAGEEIFLGQADQGIKSSKERLTLHSTLKWANVKGGGVLLLAASRAAAEARAEWLASQMDTEVNSRSIDVICRYLETEAGGEHPLTPLLKKGVAFHHAGLSMEARYFIERLVEEGVIKILCATTTLAQGVHFPLSVAIIESHYRKENVRGSWNTKEIEPWEFWNIAGRVGRTLEDSLGVIAFSTVNTHQVSKIQDYLRRDASIVSSSLMEMLEQVAGTETINFTTSLVDRVRPMSAFLQYIVHSLAVAGLGNVKRELEGVLRASFVFEQARTRDPELADELIRISRMYIDQLEAKKGPSLNGYVKLADGTGFSSPSVDVIWREWKSIRQPNADEWEESALFPIDSSISSTLVDAIETLGNIPEIKFGTEDIGRFSAERIAKIVSAWVNGKTIREIALAEYGGDLLKCTHHLYGVVTNLVPWGLRAVQKVAFVGQPDEVWGKLDVIPAMIYHGVRSSEAIAMRMLNVPRIVAEGLATEWRNNGTASVREADAWLNSATMEQWEHALPSHTRITGEECKSLWEVLQGRRSWDEI